MMQLLYQANELMLGWLIYLRLVLKRQVALRRLITVWRCG